MVPDRFATQLPAESEVLHEYGQRLLVRMPEDSGGAIDQRYASRLEDTRYLSYRAWSGRAGGNDPAGLPDLQDAYFVMALVGPMDSRWRSQIESHGLTVVDHVNPYGVLVRGGSDAVQSAAASLQTSRGHRVITHALPLPETSRFGSDVADWLRGRSDPGDIGFRTENGEPLIRVAFHDDIDFAQGHALVSDYVEAGSEFVAGGPSGQYRASAPEVSTLLEEVPEVAYVHGVFPKELHNNIAPQEHLSNIEPVWTDLGYTGTGLVAGINDSGVDESHADFPAGTIVATEGAMSGTDNGHGTHVSGTVAGRGAAPSPTNTSGCGDVTAPLPDARGMAHSSQIIHNNLFDGGVGDEAAMMQWQFQQGAVINNNSWGYGGLIGPATDYGAETVAIDGAVREADPGVDSQMAIVFSAGNSADAGVSKPANAKNVITVGASQNDRCGSYVPDECAGPDIDGMACFSSQGPSQGRNKPDIVAPGTDVVSTESTDPNATYPWEQSWTGSEYALSPGTSMSAPVVTGAATLFMEAYQDRNGDLPSPALVKAALINTATDMDGSGFPSNIQGWGRLNLRKAIEGPVEDGIALFDQDEVDHLSTGDNWTTDVGVASADEPVRFSLVWTDPPGAAGCDPCHINDLDLIVTAPDGTVYRGNQFSGAWSEPDASGRDDGNNVENVYVEAPVSGDWQVEIDGFNVSENPGDLDGQDFAVVATGDFGGFSIDPPSAEACTADSSTDFTITLSSQFETTTDLTASGLPSGTTGSFDPNPVVSPDTQSVFTVSDLGSATGGDYAIDITATDANDSSITADSSLDLTLFDAEPGQVNLSTPADGATDLDLQPDFTWSEPSEPSGYQIQVATDSGFTSIVIDETVDVTEFTPDSDLATGTDYFWRVRSSNACGDGAWSDTFEFQTRFEPVADISPESFDFLVEVDDSVTDPLSISNTGTGNLTWSIETDQVDSAVVSREFDGDFDLSNWTLENDPAGVDGSFDDEPGPPIELYVIGGNAGTGGVTDFFIEIPSDGEISFDWGFQSDDTLGCFDSGGYAVNGTYTQLACNDSEVGFFEESATVEVSEGDIFAFRATTDDGSFGAGTFGVTNFEFEAEACVEPTAVPWLTADPASGSTAGGTTDEVDITVDATGLSTGEHSAFLCVTSNDTDGPELVGVPVNVDVVDPGVGAIEGEVTSTGYCQADPGPVEGALVSVTPGPTITDVIPNVILGTGVANGDFGVERDNDIEVGLRGKLRFNDSCSAENTFNSNGDGTYSFDAGVAEDSGGSQCADPETPVWSFDWSVNTDFDDATGDVLDDYVYEMGFDADPGTGTDFLVFDPVTPSTENPFFDHAIGDNTTAAGAGTVASDEAQYLDLIANNNVAQNSWRYDFFNEPGTPLENFDPTEDGRYTVYLEVRDPGTNDVVSRSEIDILVGDAPPAPAAPYETTTDSDGSYSIEIPEEESPVNITVSADGHLDATATEVAVSGGMLTVEDFDAPVDAPCATIAPESFSFDVMLGDTDSDPLTLGNADGNIDLEWSLDHFEESGEAASQNARVTALEEDFEGTFPPADWTTVDNTGECPWLTSDDYEMLDWGGSARGAAADSDDCGSGTTADAEMISPSLDLSGLSDVQLQFDMALRTIAGTELSVDVSADGGDSWTNQETWTTDFAYPDDPSQPVEVDLSDYDGEPDVQVRWHYITDGWHYWTFVDNVAVEGDVVTASCDLTNDVDWLSMSPDSGTTAPGNSDDATVSVDSTGLADGVYEATLCVATNDPNAAQTEVPVELAVTNPALGTLEGTVMTDDCGADPEPLADALITIEGQTDSFTTMTDSDGFYSIKIHEDESPVDVTAGHDDYIAETQEDLSITGLDTTVADFTLTLDAPCIDTDPESLSTIVDLGQTVDETVDVSNFGTQPLDWLIEVEPEGSIAGELAEIAAENGANARNPEAAPHPSAEEEAAGNVAASASVKPGEPWVTGQVRHQLLQEGVVLVPQSTNSRIMAFDPETGDLIDADFITYTEDLGTLQHALPHPDGERLLVVSQGDAVHEFDLDGNYVGVFAPAGGIDTSIMSNTRGMAFHPDTGNLLVTSASGDNSDSVVEFDLDGNFLDEFIGSGSGGLSGPWSIQFRDDDLLVSASGGGIFRYDHAGSFQDTWNGDIGFTEQLKQIENGNVLAAEFGSAGVWEFDPDGNQLDTYGPETNLRGVHELPSGNILTTNSGGVHEIDRDGNLVETKISGSSHQISFVQMLDCTAPDWVSFDPLSGTVNAGDPPDTLTVTFDPSGLAPGDYEGNFCVQSNDPVRPSAQVPVSMTAELPADWGTIQGTVQGLGYCNDDPGALANATVEIVGAEDTHVLETDENGFFEAFLPETESPLEFTVSAPNHQDVTSTVDFSGGDVVVEDFDLLLDEPCATAQPEDISVEMDPDETLTGALELGNTDGNATLNWSIDTAMPTELRDSTPPAGEASAGDDSAGLSLIDVLGESPASRDVIQPMQDAVDCDAAPGLIVHDDGSVENGYTGNPDVVGEVALVDHFVPSTYPASLNAVCVTFVRAAGGPETLDFEIVVFADDGPGGAPGTELGALDASVSGIPEFPITDPVWASYDISSLGVALAEGGAYIGVRYAPTDPGVFVAGDESTTNPVGFAGGHWWNDNDAAWAPIEDAFADYRSLFVRAVEGVIDCSNPVGVPWLGMDPAFGIVDAGDEREIDIDFDTSGLSPGTYEAGLCIFSNDPVNEVLTVPVTLNVRIPTDWATIEGTVESLGYCEEDPGPLEGATVEAAGVADTYTAQTDASGTYEIFLPADEAPVDVTASHADHVADTEAGVGLSAGTTTQVDFGLAAEDGCTSNDPDSYDVTLVTGNSTSEMLTLTNAGAGDANFDITSAEQVESATVELQRQAREARSLGDESREQSLPERSASQREVEVTARAEITALVVSPDGEVGDSLPPTNLVDALNSFPDVTADRYSDPLADITVSDLEPYDVVVTTNNTQWAAASGAVPAGDALADYVDQDGKLVLFNYAFDHAGWELGGRYIDEGYGPFEMATADVTGSVSMNILDGAHPIFDGVSTLSADALRINVQPRAGAELIAEWSDGEALIAHNDHTVAFNALYSADGADIWTGDLDLMAYNAAQFIAAGASGDPAPWLSFAPETGTVSADDSSDVSVTFDADGLDAGTYEADILVNLDEGGEDGTTLSVPATMEVLDPAVIDVDPTELTSVLEDGDTDLQSFNIANSGEAALDWSIDDTTSGCELPGWASVAPTSGSLETGNDEDVDVTFDATGLEADVYNATVCVDSNDPDSPVAEVDLQLTVEETLATVEGVVTSLGYCGENPSVAGGAGIVIEGQSNTYSDSADGSGFYQINVPADESPVSVTASHGGHITGTTTDVELTAGTVSTVDMDLVLEAPCASVAPASLSFSLLDGDESDSLTIDNSGGGASLNWTLESGTGCYEPATDTWLTLSSNGDTVGAGSSQAVDVTADASGLEPGEYTTEVCVGTNDGEAEDFSVPVELNVLGEAIFQDRFEGGETD